MQRVHSRQRTPARVLDTGLRATTGPPFSMLESLTSRIGRPLAQYEVTDQIAMTSDMRVNVLAGDIFGDSFYYSWQLIGARYRF